MQVHEIRREHAHKKAKLVARGGKRGKTAGRGGKGQTARAGNKRRPALRDVIKKLPKLRGHGKNRSESVFYRGPEAVVNVSALNIFKAGDEVNPRSLHDMKLINIRFDKMPKVKILGTGELTVKLAIVGCDVSKTAEGKITALGGTITLPVLSPVVSAMHAKGEALAEAKAAKKANAPVKEKKEKPAKKK